MNDPISEKLKMMVTFYKDMAVAIDRYAAIRKEFLDTHTESKETFSVLADLGYSIALLTSGDGNETTPKAIDLVIRNFEDTYLREKK